MTKTKAKASLGERIIGYSLMVGVLSCGAYALVTGRIMEGIVVIAVGGFVALRISGAR